MSIYTSKEQLTEWAISHNGVGGQIEHIARKAAEHAARACAELAHESKLVADALLKALGDK